MFPTLMSRRLGATGENQTDGTRTLVVRLAWRADQARMSTTRLAVASAARMVATAAGLVVIGALITAIYAPIPLDAFVHLYDTDTVATGVFDHFNCSTHRLSPLSLPRRHDIDIRELFHPHSKAGWPTYYIHFLSGRSGGSLSKLPARLWQSGAR